MSAPPPGPGGAWDLIEEGLDEEELEQLAALSPEERHRALKDAGLEPADARALVAGALGGQAAAPPPAPVVSLARERERRRRPVWAVLLVAAAVALALVGGGAEVVALLTPEPPPVPTVPPLLPEPGPTPAEQAATLRLQAYVSVAKGYFGDAQRQLDQARELDPAGETSPDVQKARADIRVGIDPHTFEGSKPGGRPRPRPVPRDL